MAMARPLPADLRQQALAHDAFQHQRQLRANLRLLVGRKNVDNSVDGRGCRVGVQRAESQVAGFSDTQRRLDGFQVAHFADQHHVRIFTEGGAQSVGKLLVSACNSRWLTTQFLFMCTNSIGSSMVRM